MRIEGEIGAQISGITNVLNIVSFNNEIIFPEREDFSNNFDYINGSLN